MDIVFKTVAALLSAMVIFAGGTALAVSNAAESDTNNYFESVSECITESNYSDRVIRSLKEDAREKGHSLEVTVYEKGIAGEKKYADIRLDYTYRVDLFGISIPKTKQKVV